MEMVKEVVGGRPVVIFSKSSCCISHAIVMLIRGFGASPVVYELDHVPNGGQMEKALMGLGCNPSVPAVFIGTDFVGGSNEIMSLNIKGKLKPLLIQANAIWM
ncbi:Thioredoxin superfamily protein [Perilla frutescens var. hirtella]|uniref:Thioredoxin superfamily protein n=1 Tax=Perilla frutescens var. hirtella TaxID=608512 RepID=A0AAD4PCC5_PERFH|nr:Thioredoxin superfamily protein [Perilla frutescens var. hirtella]